MNAVRLDEIHRFSARRKMHTLPRRLVRNDICLSCPWGSRLWASKSRRKVSFSKLFFHRFPKPMFNNVWVQISYQKCFEIIKKQSQTSKSWFLRMQSFTSIRTWKSRVQASEDHQKSSKNNFPRTSWKKQCFIARILINVLTFWEPHLRPVDAPF